MAAKKQPTATKAAKTPSISKEEFLANAETVELKIGDQVVGHLQPREFAKGSWGYGFYMPTTIKIGDKRVDLQSSVSFTVKHSAKAAEAA
jgi:hypothetical protein